jgi:hypothetical protein
MDAQLKRELIEALHDAKRYGAGNWDHLVKQLENEPVECNNWPGCPCDSKADCQGAR